MNKVLVFSTPFCAVCPGVKKKLVEAGIEFEDINAIKFPLLVKEYGIKSVPSIIVSGIDDSWNNYGNDLEGAISASKII